MNNRIFAQRRSCFKIVEDCCFMDSCTIAQTQIRVFFVRISHRYVALGHVFTDFSISAQKSSQRHLRPVTPRCVGDYTTCPGRFGLNAINYFSL